MSLLHNLVRTIATIYYVRTLSLLKAQLSCGSKTLYAV